MSDTWTHRLARLAVRPLLGSRVTIAGAWGCHPDHALHRLGQAAWSGLLMPMPMPVASAIGTGIMAVVIPVRLRRLPRRSHPTQQPA